MLLVICPSLQGVAVSHRSKRRGSLRPDEAGGRADNELRPEDLDDVDELLERSALAREGYEHASGRHELLRQLASARKRVGLRQSDVATHMGTTQSAISELEGGLVDPRLSSLQR